jgi:hypothetical protein
MNGPKSSHRGRSCSKGHVNKLNTAGSTIGLQIWGEQQIAKLPIHDLQVLKHDTIYSVGYNSAPGETFFLEATMVFWLDHLHPAGLTSHLRGHLRKLPPESYHRSYLRRSPVLRTSTTPLALDRPNTVHGYCTSQISCLLARKSFHISRHYACDRFSYSARK